MARNYWTERASDLAEAYQRHADSLLGGVRFEIVTRTLLEQLPAGPSPLRVVDVGGGYGRQAVLLARAGHEVVVVDPDQGMLDSAARALGREGAAVQKRVTLVAGPGERAVDLVGTGFDLVCCHSVLMYLDDPAPLLSSLAALARAGGLISVLSVNPAALAMRAGLQGNWAEAAATLRAGEETGEEYLPSRLHPMDDVAALLKAAGAPPTDWYGVRVFTDHLGDEEVDDELSVICEAEWLAGRRDPYRQVARMYHLLARRL